MTSRAEAPLHIRPFRPHDEADVVALWEACGLVVSHNDPAADIALKCAFQPDLFFVGVDGDTLVATVMAGYEGHRGWINYLAVSPSHQRRGCGRLLMRHAEQALFALGCPKVNLQVRPTNDGVAAFYRSIGYEFEDRLNFGRRRPT